MVILIIVHFKSHWTILAVNRKFKFQDEEVEKFLVLNESFNITFTKVASAIAYGIFKGG